MKTNMGKADKIIRFIIAAAIVTLFATGIISGIFAYVLLLFAGVFVLTSIIGFCPLYTLFGIKTCAIK